MIDKHAVPTKLLWVDLEMTGLDAHDDLIIEIAAEITDFEFKTLATYEAVVQQPRAQVLSRLQKNAWWAEHTVSRDAILSKMAAGKPSHQVEQEMVALVNEHFGSEPAILAGNSIHSDRKFIAQWWPELDLQLHYRMLDVSSFKVVMQAKYDAIFEKKEVHRAYDDIQASIAELQYYLGWFHEHGSSDS